MSDLMREEFETWSGDKSDKEIHQRGPRAGKYKNPVMQRSWEAWQASRGRLVIELPEKARITDPSDMLFIGSNGAINKCRDAIHAAGVKTK